MNINLKKYSNNSVKGEYVYIRNISFIIPNIYILILKFVY